MRYMRDSVISDDTMRCCSGSVSDELLGAIWGGTQQPQALIIKLVKNANFTNFTINISFRRLTY